MRKINLTLHRFHELSPEAQFAALDNEREYVKPDIQNTISSLFIAELAKANAFLVSCAINFDTEEIVVRAAPDTDEIHALLRQIGEVAKKEIPQFLSDSHLRGNISADGLEFLADGTRWLYRSL